VFVHGNGTMLEDMLISGVIDHAAQRYRAVAFDRPGFGYSERPDTRTWTAAAQASLLPEAFPPTAVLAGDVDEVVSHRQAQRLHGDVAGSHLDILSGGSHMVHHIAPERVVRAIDAIASEAAASRPLLRE
jgi:pimeloyl-ACP methyl ester carboxylesterase